MCCTAPPPSFPFPHLLYPSLSLPSPISYGFTGHCSATWRHLCWLRLARLFLFAPCAGEPSSLTKRREVVEVVEEEEVEEVEEEVEETGRPIPAKGIALAL